MKYIYCTFLICLLSAIQLHGQSVLYYENFENSSSFTLNTTDNGCLGMSGSNQWLINNMYAGGSWIYGGFFPVNVPPTPSQPGQIFNNPYSNYLHTVCVAASMSGIKNCNFIDAPSSMYVIGDAGKIFSKMNQGINTTGYYDVKISFWWLCYGGQGTMYYSTTGGNTWNQFGNFFNSTNNWTYAEFSNPEFDNKPDIRFGFQFSNLSGIAQDPGFAIDEIYVKGILSNNAPVASFSASKNSICQNECVNFNDLSSNQPDTWNWLFEGANPSTSNQQNPTDICYSQSGQFNVSLIVSNQYGADTLTQQHYIAVTPSPLINLGENLILMPGNTITLDAGNGSQYVWSTGDTTQTILVNQTGTYSVTVTSNSCSANASVEVIDFLNTIPVIPNIITPNGDGINDFFEIKNLEIFKQNTLIIYNRWGNKVFESTSYNNKWDGKTLSDGVYFYVYENEKGKYQGSITILK